MPYVSVLIPLCNGVEYLEECVQSILCQTYKDFDIWIGVNGHTTDTVAKLALNLREKDLRIYVHIQGPSIQGKVQSLNDLMNYAEGEWIALLDVDDIWAPTKLEEQIMAKSNLAKNVAVIGTMCEYFGEFHGKPEIPTGFLDSASFANVNPIINSSVLVHRSYCRWRYTEHWFGMEDYDLWMRIALTGGRLYTIPKVLCYHRIHTTSAFNSKGHSPEALQALYRTALSTYFYFSPDTIV